jgi:hypothetical protein
LSGASDASPRIVVKGRLAAIETYWFGAAPPLQLAVAQSVWLPLSGHWQ